MLKRFRSRFHNRKGQGMVEFALVIPLLLLLLLMIVELGHMLFFYISVYSAAREGARYGAAVDDSDGTAKFADQVGIRDAAQRIAFIAGLADDQIDIQYDCGVPSARTTGIPNCTTGMLRVAVTVDATYESIVPIPAVPDFQVASTVVRTVVNNVEVEGNFPIPPAPTATTAPDCSKTPKPLKGHPYDKNLYPDWYVLVLEGDVIDVSMSVLDIHSNIHVKQVFYDIKIPTGDPAHPYRLPASTTENPNNFDTNYLWTGNDKSPLIYLEGRQLDEVPRYVYIQFKDGTYNADIMLGTWCGPTPIFNAKP